MNQWIAKMQRSTEALMAVDAIIPMQATTIVPMQPSIVFAMKESVDFYMKPSSELTSSIFAMKPS